MPQLLLVIGGACAQCQIEMVENTVRPLVLRVGGRRAIQESNKPLDDFCQATPHNGRMTGSRPGHGAPMKNPAAGSSSGAPDPGFPSHNPTSKCCEAQTAVQSQPNIRRTFPTLQMLTAEIDTDGAACMLSGNPRPERLLSQRPLGTQALQIRHLQCRPKNQPGAVNQK